ncbi:MAG: hypothetical protein WDM92_05385 [Caulobacteraceae bacterium]
MQRRQIEHFRRADPAYGEGVEARLGLASPRVAAE